MAITVKRLREVFQNMNGAQLMDVQCSFIRIENLLPDDVSKALYLADFIKIANEELKNKQN